MEEKSLGQAERLNLVMRMSCNGMQTCASIRKGFKMRSILFCVLLAVASSSLLASQSQQERSTTPATQVITGVIDQKGDTFVISDLKKVKPIAKLKAEGFSDDNFARFVGMKVRVRGRMVSEKDQSVLQVRNLSDIEKLDSSSQK